MKHFSFLLLLFIVNYSVAQSWFDTQAGISQNKNGDFVIIDADHVFIIADHGKFYRTSDGGNTWVSKDLNLDIPYYAIDFINTQEGYVAGANGNLLKTIDGGNNWFCMNTGTQEDLMSVCMLNSNDIFCVGTNGTFLQSNDGGATWINRSDITSEHLYDIDFVDSSTGYLTGRNTLLKTLDGGLNWVNIFPDDIGLAGNDFYSLSFDGTDVRFVYGDILSDYQAVGWGILLSHDAGNTWQMEMAYPMCTTHYMLWAMAVNHVLFWTSVEASSAQTMDLFKWNHNESNPDIIWGYCGCSSSPIHRAQIKAVDENILYMFYDDYFLKTIDGGVNAIENNTADVIHISPNPAVNFVDIHTDVPIKELFLYDMSGKLLHTGQEKHLELSHLPKGIYLLKILLNNNTSFEEKLIIGQ